MWWDSRKHHTGGEVIEQVGIAFDKDGHNGKATAFLDKPRCLHATDPVATAPGTDCILATELPFGSLSRQCGRTRRLSRRSCFHHLTTPDCADHSELQMGLTTDLTRFSSSALSWHSDTSVCDYCSILQRRLKRLRF